MHNTVLLVIVIVTAVGFDVTNGFHDTANAMATSIATGALKPRIAVLLSAVLNIVGAFLSLKVAATIASGIVEAGFVTLPIVFAGLVGAIVWNLVTWLAGLPSSSSHALIGGVVGATLVAVGRKGVHFDAVVSKVIVPAVASPLIAALVATVGTFSAYKITQRARKGPVGHGFRVGQIASASLVSLAHGTNDAQKTMGVITLALIADGRQPNGTPDWVIIICALAIGTGTYTGGWRVIRTLGKGLVEVEAPQGFAAEAASSAVILLGSHYGFPLSTTHVCSGSVLGSGLGKRLAEVHWNVMGRMATAWILTLPAAALVAALVGKVQDSIGGSAGVVIMAAAAALFAASIYALPGATRSPPTMSTSPRTRRNSGSRQQQERDEMSKYVDWSALGKVLGIGLGAGAGAVILFSIGVVGVAQYAQGREEQQNKIGGLALAVVCFAVCLAAVGYGIVLMTDK